MVDDINDFLAIIRSKKEKMKFSMSAHKAHLKKILQNGEWWTYPWWLEDQYYMNGLFDKNEVEIIFEEIKKVFNG